MTEKATSSESCGHPEFRKVLDEMWAMHSKKGADYGNGKDIFANIRASEEFGIPGWKGAVLRGNDKMSRLKSFFQNGVLKNESVEDSLLDLANYAVIALVMYRQEQEKERKPNAMDSIGNPVYCPSLRTESDR